MQATEHTTSMRAAGTVPERVLLRAVRGECGEPGVDGDRSDLPEGFEQPSWGRPPDLPLSAERIGDQRTGPGVVQRHHVYPGTAGIFVFSGGDGLVESLRAGLGVEQQ